MHACLDRTFVHVDPSPFLVLGPISQTKSQTLLHKDLANYLLLLPDERDFRIPDTNPDTSYSATTERLPTQLEARIFDFCVSELDKATQSWRDWTQENPQGITADMLRVVTNFCVVASALASLGDIRQSRIQALESAADKLTQSFVSFLTRRETDEYKVDAVIEVSMKSLPDVQRISKLSPSLFKQAGIFLLANHLSKALGTRTEIKQSFHLEEDDDFMDVDEPQGSQLTGGSYNPDLDVPRHDIQAASEPAALRAICAAYCQLVASATEPLADDEERIPAAFVDYLATINEAELLRCRPLLSALLSSRFRLPTTSCVKLLDRLSESLIDPRARQHNTSEVANSMMVDTLIGTTLEFDPGATDREGQEFYEIVEELYVYYIRDMEKGGVRRSPNLQSRIADLLHKLLKHHPNFGQNRKSPSVRTSLFGLLGHGEITVMHHIAECLPSVFEDFILPEHDKIFQDVDNSLPSDTNWSEGVAIRLEVLSRLASRWHTLLRQGVYHIFAIAGSVEDAAHHARWCIRKIAKARELEDSKALFRLLAPQIIFTWLDRKRKFSEIPFLTFDYATLTGLLSDIESEAVGQAMMLGLTDEIDYLGKAFGLLRAEVLKRNISKAAAYTISWDTCKGSARNKSVKSYAMLLREHIGPVTYETLIRDNSARVFGYILQTIDNEERIVKSLEKRPAYSATAKALNEMHNISNSEQRFDLGIEPSFNAFYLIDQLERLCRRTGDNPVDFWKPNNYTFVLRMLLDRLHPALGSLYARSIIRKIRILVALAGDVAYQGYPLQMALQSLRPFLTDIQCAEDTFGIVQYLFEHGHENLRSNLRFVTGIGLSILISIRVFLGSSQESTTQQSQHTATMNKAVRFHKWLTDYLGLYADILHGERPSSVKAFREIITAASRIRTEGNSLKGSKESKLLLEILKDVGSDQRLLNNTSREVALDLLCQNFQPASSAREDVLDSDAKVAEYAPQVWGSCQRNNIGDGYMLWAARVLGRAFGAHGEVKRSVDHSRPWAKKAYSSKDPLGKVSRDAIVRKIEDLFYSDDRKEVGLAEGAIRLLLSRLSTDTDREKLGMLEPIKTALALSIPLEHKSQVKAPRAPETLKQNAMPTKRKSVSLWIRDLAVCLCHVASADPILGSLANLLMGIDDMAEALFPYILHLVLLQEFEADRSVRQTISEATMSWFSDCDTVTAPYVRILIEAILYLRSQAVPKEVTRVDRDYWLEIDYLEAAQAATVCHLYRSALLFAETASGRPIRKSASRRPTVYDKPPEIPLEMQISIYKNLDELDSFYGIDRGSSLSAVVDRLDYEADGVKSLIFRGARLDSQIRRSNAIEPSDSRGMVKSLINLNMNSITHSLLSDTQFKDVGDDVVDNTLHTARKLGQWDIKAPEERHGEATTLFKAFQSLHYATDAITAKSHLNRQLLATMNLLAGRNESSTSAKSHLRTLAVLTEADEVLDTVRPEHLYDVWDQMKSREKWMRAGE